MLFFSACSLSFSGSDGGVFRSDDGGKTFSRKITVDQNRNIGSVDVLSLAVNPQDGNEAYIGTAASGIFKTGNAGDSWKPLPIGQTTPQKVYSIAISPQDPQTIYATVVIGKRGKIVKSENGGAAWKEVYTEPAGNTLVLAVAINPSNPQNVYAGTQGGQIVASEDGGETWRNVFTARNNKAVYRIAFDNINTSTIYFVLFEDGVLRSSDAGKSFQELKRNSEEKLSASRGLQGSVSIVTDPLRAGWVYVSTSEGLLRSRDRGDNWEVVSTLNKPKEQKVRSMAINPTNSDEIACGVAQAFYKSNDGGINWLPVQFSTQKTLEVIQYNRQNPAVIYVGLNKR